MLCGFLSQVNSCLWHPRWVENPCPQYWHLVLLCASLICCCSVLHVSHLHPQCLHTHPFSDFFDILNLQKCPQYSNIVELCIHQGHLKFILCSSASSTKRYYTSVYTHANIFLFNFMYKYAGIGTRNRIC